MGASVGVYLDKMSPELREAIEYNEKQKYTIAEYDSAMLDRETAKIFKKHGKVIKTLTSRTKAQLKRTISIKGKVPDDIYKIIGGNNNYSLFMKQLHMTKQEIEMENLKNSSKTELYDEEMLVNIVGTSTNKELKLFYELYEKEKGTSLADVFIAKTKPESQLQRFISKCWTFNRNESKNIDIELATKQAMEIHKAGASRLLGCDEDVIFSILISNSRLQCSAIADSYLSQFNMKFERAINMKFKGNCAKLMLLWSLPIPSAIITCIHSYEERMLLDKVAIISMISKYDKDVLAQIDISCEKIYDKNLIGTIQRGLSGNVLKAVTNWIENPSPDKGYERVTEIFIENQLNYTTTSSSKGSSGSNKTMQDLLKNEEFQKRLLFLIKKESEEISSYMKNNRIKFNPEDKLDLKALNDTVHSMESFNSNSSSNINNIQKEIIQKYSVKNPEERSGEGYEAKYNAIQSYLKSYFAFYDHTNIGSFSEMEFWDIMKKLPLEDLGLTESDIEAMTQWSEWVSEERVNYHEAIYELSDSIITSIENKDKNNSSSNTNTNVLEIIQQLYQNNKLIKGTSEQKIGLTNNIAGISNVPEYFLQYIYDTFYAYDFDNNGYLCIEELNSVLPVLNLGMTYIEFIPNEREKIAHKDAVRIIAQKVQPLFLDHDNDNYICLVDKDSGLFFWYNCRDESSQWADCEGEGWAGYGSRRPSRSDMVFSNSIKMAALGLDAEGNSQPTSPSAGTRSPRAPTTADEEGKEVESAQKKRGIAEMCDEPEADEKTTAGAISSKSGSKKEPIAADVPSLALSSKEKAESSAKDKETKEESKEEAKEAVTGSRTVSPRGASPRASPRAAAESKSTKVAADSKTDFAAVVAEQKPVSPRPSDLTVAEQKPVSPRPSDLTVAEEKSASPRPSDPTVAEEKPASPRPSDPTVAEEKPVSPRPSGSQSTAPAADAMIPQKPENEAEARAAAGESASSLKSANNTAAVSEDSSAITAAVSTSAKESSEAVDVLSAD